MEKISLLLILLTLSAANLHVVAQQNATEPDPQQENAYTTFNLNADIITRSEAIRHTTTDDRTAGLWTGSVSSDWHTAGNWSDNTVPTSLTNVTIQSGTFHQPVISSQAYCNNLSMLANTTLTQNSGSYFHVYGTFDVGYEPTSYFTMNGSSYLYFRGGANNDWWDDYNNGTYSFVRVNKSSTMATTFMKNSATCDGTFQIWNGNLAISSGQTLAITSTSNEALRIDDGGTLNLEVSETIDVVGGVRFINGSQANVTGGTIICGGNFRVEENLSNSIQLTDATVVLNGTGNQLIQDIDGNSIHHLTINKPSGTATVDAANLSIAGHLNINSGTFSLGEYNCDVTGNLNIYGSLIMPHTATQALNAFGNVAWFAGSSANMSSSSHIHVFGNWNFNNGSSVNLNNGFVDFRGSNISWIRSNCDNSNFHHLQVHKTDGFAVNFSNSSSHDLIVNGYVHLSSTSVLNSYSNQNIILRGNLFLNGIYDFTLFGNNGSVIFDGSSQTIHNYGAGSGIFNNVVINSTTGTTVSDGDITIAGNLTIEQGSLSPGTNTINVAGDWTNNNFPAGFVPGDGSVVFNGSHNQSILSDENFNILEADLGGHIMVDNAAHTVTCNQYDWTSGGIEVLAGTFTALDLAQNGLYGDYRVNPGGEINLHQDDGSFIDLNGSLTFNGGGTISVYGGSTTCFIPWAGNASISMNGGMLDFKDHGIYIGYSPDYTFTHNITGGVIRTTGALSVPRNDFTPSGGTFEFYGSSNRLLTVSSGSHLYNLRINKSSEGDKGNKLSHPVYDSRSGEMITDGGRSTAISLGSNIMVTNNLVVESGTLNIGGHELTVNKKADVYGTLNMTNAAGVLNVGTLQYDNLWFYPGSTGNLTHGEVNLKSWLAVDAGASFTANTHNTINFIGSNVGGGLANDEPTALFGNVEINKTANAAYFSLTRTGPYNIQGDFTIHAGNVFQTGGKPIKISGLFNNAPTSSTLLYYDVTKNNENLCSPDAKPLVGTSGVNTRSGVMEIESDFILYGLMDVGPGSVEVKQYFRLSTNGTLNISGGSFINSRPYTISWTNMNGTLNMTSGLFELTYNHPYFYGSSNVSGGIIRTGGAIGAEVADAFKPSGGTVEVTGSGLGVIKVYNGNYFHNLVINRTGLYAGFDQTQPVIINNNLLVNNGRISSLTSSINVFGNVIVNDGGILEIANLGSLLLGASRSLTVNNGGTLELTGNITNQPKLSRISSGHYGINVESGGTIAAEYALFEYMNTDGINIKPGAIVDHSKAFHNCTFRLGQSGGRLMTINNSQTFAVNNASFPYNSWDGVNNVSKTVNSGVVTFMGYGGDFAGATYEQDPNSRIHWGGQTAANVTLQGVDIVPGQDICFEATNTLTIGGGGSVFEVQNGGYVELVAGEKIRMLEGTHFHNGSYGLARITTTSDYCSLPAAMIAVNEETLTTVDEIVVPEPDNLFFKVYPNPTTGMFTLELADADETAVISVEIYTMLGESLLRNDLPPMSHYQFDLSGHQPGIYLIRVMMRGEVGVKKLIKQ